MNFGFSYSPAVSTNLYSAEQMAAFHASVDAARTADELDNVLFEATRALHDIRYNNEAQWINDDYMSIFYDTVCDKTVSAEQAKPRAKELLKRIERFRR